MGAKGKAYELELEGGGWRLPADAVLDTDERREEYLAAAREHHQHIFCYCQEPPVAMSVALRRKTGRYYLTPAQRASKANTTPPKHRNDCRLYHGDKGPSANDGGTLPGVEPQGDGVRVYLAAAGFGDPSSEQKHPPAKTDTERKAQPRKTRERLDFSYLLRLWWTRAGLTAWQGEQGHSTWFEWRDALMREAEKIQITKNHRLSDVLFLPQAFDKRKQEEIESEYREFVAEAMANAEKEDVGRPRILAGVVKDLCDGAAGAKKLHLWHKAFSIVVPEELVDSFLEQAKVGRTIEEERECGEGQPSSPRIFVLVLARPQRAENKEGKVWFWWKASEIAAITIHPRTAIPVESSYELQVAQALASAGRGFVKPFPGHAGEFAIDGMTPDFVCIDRTPPVYLEVYGRMGDPEYARHTEEKRARYHMHGITAWEWDPLASPQMPDLPD